MVRPEQGYCTRYNIQFAGRVVFVLIITKKLKEAGPFLTYGKAPISANSVDLIYFRVVGRNAARFRKVERSAVKYKLSQYWVGWGRLTVENPTEWLNLGHNIQELWEDSSSDLSCRHARDKGMLY